MQLDLAAARQRSYAIPKGELQEVLHQAPRKEIYCNVTAIGMWIIKIAKIFYEKWNIKTYYLNGEKRSIRLNRFSYRKNCR